MSVLRSQDFRQPVGANAVLARLYACFDDPRRIAGHEASRRNIFHNDTPGDDDAVIPNGYTGEYEASGANLAITSNMSVRMAHVDIVVSDDYRSEINRGVRSDVKSRPG